MTHKITTGYTKAVLSILWFAIASLFADELKHASLYSFQKATSRLYHGLPNPEYDNEICES